jgi:hypothetical protein
MSRVKRTKPLHRQKSLHQQKLEVSFMKLDLSDYKYQPISGNAIPQELVGAPAKFHCFSPALRHRMVVRGLPKRGTCEPWGLLVV